MVVVIIGMVAIIGALTIVIVPIVVEVTIVGVTTVVTVILAITKEDGMEIIDEGTKQVDFLAHLQVEDCPGPDEARASDSTIEECNGSPSSHLMIDSGCTRHLIGSSLAHFIEKREPVSKRMIQMANGSQCSSSLMVTARIPLHNGNTLVVSKALYTPELKGSYISVGQLSDIEGMRLTFVRDKLFIQRGSGTKKSTIGVAERSNNNLYFLRVREQSSEERLAAVHSDIDYALNLHCRLGHPDVRVLRKATKEGSITGLPKEMRMKSFGDCIICTQ